MKKLLTAIIAAVLCVCGSFGLTACTPPAEPVIKGVASATFDESKDQLVVATNAAFAPFEYKLGNKFAGIDIEIVKGLADSLGKELVILDMKFDGVVQSVGSGGADLAAAGLTVNPQRAEHVTFSDSYYTASQYILVPASNTEFDACTTAAEVEAILNVAGKKIGAQVGTTGYYLAKGDADWDFAGYTNAETLAFDNAGLAVTEMKAGLIDYVVVDAAPAEAMVKVIPGIKAIKIALTEEEYAFGIAKDNTELLQQVNAYLAQIKQDGTFDAICEKYFTHYGE